MEEKKDGPTRRIRFWNMPSEVHGLVTSYLNWSDIVHLIECGDPMVIYSLSQPMSIISFKAPKQVWTYFSKNMPSLYTLELYDPFAAEMRQPLLPSVFSEGFSVANMPSSLTNLSVNVATDNWLRVSSDGDASPSYYNLQNLLPFLRSLSTGFALDTVHQAWISTWPLSLTKIHFLKILVAVPSNIIDASISIMDNAIIEAHKDLVTALPQVESFSVSLSLQEAHEPWLKAFFYAIPSSMTSLTLPLYPEGFDLNLLPRQLQTLRWRVGLSQDTNTENFSWPPELRELEIGPVPTKLFLKLPNQLSKLLIDFLGMHVFTDMETLRLHFSSLPDSLTRFETITPPPLVCPGENRYVAFPASLHTLRFVTYDTTPTNVSHLPPTVTDLAIGAIGAPHVAQLPKTLTALETGELRLEISLLSALPPTLTTLRASLASPYPQLAGALVNPLWQKQLLPPHAAWTQILQETLNLEKSQPLTVPAPRFPPSLTQLCLQEAHQLGDEFVTLLPQGLTHLWLDDDQSLSNAAIAALPRALTALGLPANGKLTSKCFQTLPPNLTQLNFNEVSELVENEDLAHLPQTLTEVHFASLQLNDQHVPWLPPKLRIATLSSSSFTQPIKFMCDAHLDFAPPSPFQ